MSEFGPPILQVCVLALVVTGCWASDSTPSTPELRSPSGFAIPVVGLLEGDGSHGLGEVQIWRDQNENARDELGIVRFTNWKRTAGVLEVFELSNTRGDWLFHEVSSIPFNRSPPRPIGDLDRDGIEDFVWVRFQEDGRRRIEFYYGPALARGGLTNGTPDAVIEGTLRFDTADFSSHDRVVLAQLEGQELPYVFVGLERKNPFGEGAALYAVPTPLSATSILADFPVVGDVRYANHLDGVCETEAGVDGAILVADWQHLQPGGRFDDGPFIQNAWLYSQASELVQTAPKERRIWSPCVAHYGSGTANLDDVVCVETTDQKKKLIFREHIGHWLWQADLATAGGEGQQTTRDNQFICVDSVTEVVSWASPCMTFGVSETGTMQLEDLNGDGIQDLVFACSGVSERIEAPIAMGIVFGPIGELGGKDAVLPAEMGVNSLVDLTFGDLDGDGRLDLIYVEEDRVSVSGHHWWMKRLVYQEDLLEP